MSYHNNTSASTSGVSGAGITYTSSAFVKEKDGITAPLGFHFMDDGTLMSDAEHIRVHGYDEKVINSFVIDTKDISHLGESRAFSIQGSGIFSLEISDTDNNYYNFNTQTWSTTKSGLYRVELLGAYDSSINFPAIAFTNATCDLTNTDATIDHDDDDGAIKVGMLVAGTGIPLGSTVASVTSDERFELSAAATATATNETLSFSILRNFTINLFAETAENIKTKHVEYVEAINIDGSISINKSTGSNSNLLKKIIYQDVVKNLYLSCIAPSLTTASSDTVTSFTGSGTTSRVVITTGNATDKNVVQIGDKVTGTGVAASIHALVTKINPDGDNVKEIEISANDDIADDAAITFTPAFNGITPNGVVSTTGQQSFEASSGGDLKKSFSITCTAQTGRTLSVSKIPTIADLCTFTTVTFGADPIVIPGEDISSSTHYGWPVTNIAGLQSGMSLDPARAGTGVNTTTPATISKYISTKTDLKLVQRRHYTDVNSITVNDIVIDGINPDGNIITAVDRNKNATAQIGNIIFSKQQANALKADSGVRIFAYGAEQIKSLTGMDVAISDIVITPTQVSTTVDGAVSASATIGLDEVANVSSASTIRGVNINSSAVNPTVLVKAATSGGVNITASSVQTLEDGQTLFFDNASNILTITGTIEISNVALSDTTLYLDVERFLNVS